MWMARSRFRAPGPGPLHGNVTGAQAEVARRRCRQRRANPNGWWSTAARSRSRIPTRCSSPRPGTPSSTSCATTSPSPTARCAAPAAAQRAGALSERHRRASSSIRSARPTSRPRLDRGRRRCSFPRAARAEEVVPRDAAALAWMANLACLELHPHPVRAEDLDHPDELRVDLDPVPGVEWPQVREVARVVRARRSTTSGSSAGPRRRARAACTSSCASSRAGRFDEVRRAALALAREVERRAPTLATSKWWKEERHGVFLDYNQNAKDRTVAAALLGAAHARRARVGAARVGRGRRLRAGGLHAATMPARFASSAIRTRASTSTPARSRALLELSARHEKRGTGRRAVAAALPEAGRASRRVCSRRDSARASKHPADRNRPRAEEGGRAGGARALEGAPSRGGGASRAGGRAGGCDARPLHDLDAHPRQPAARASRRPGTADPTQERAAIPDDEDLRRARKAA